MGITSLTLTNINSTCDAWDFVLYCKKQNIKPVLGAEIRNGDKFLYILIASNNKGFTWINKFISDHLLNEKPFPEMAEEEHFFQDWWDGFVVYPFDAKKLEDFFCNEYLGIRTNEINKLHAINSVFKAKLVIRQPVTFQDKVFFNVHKLLRCVDNNILLSKLNEETICSATEYFLSPSQLLNAFKHYPFIVTNTYKLMDSCSIEMDFSKDKNKKIFGASKEDDKVFLAKLSKDGLISR